MRFLGIKIYNVLQYSLKILQCCFITQPWDVTHTLHPTDLRAARGAAHIRPVLFVIHVIHKPATQRRQEQHVNLQPRHAACREVCLYCAMISVLCSVFLSSQTECPQIQLSSYYHVFIVEAVCNEVDATDDGCFTLRHNIISRKMIPLVPAGVQQSWRLTAPQSFY